MVLAYLTVLYDKGLGYSSNNTAQAAICSFVCGKINIHNNGRVSRFMNGMFNDRPAMPRLRTIGMTMCILKGVKRIKVNIVSQKLPITMEVLKGILTKLDLSSSFDRWFWAASLAAFFSFFWKSNLLVQSPSSFDP